MGYTRNEFLRMAGLAGAASLIPAIGFSKNEIAKEFNPKMGLASYTLRKFKLDDVIKMTRAVGLNNIALKDMHMPLNSSPEEIKNIAGQIRSAGLNLYGAGVIYMKTAQEVENAFAYAVTAGLEMIIGVPDHELLPLVNEQVRKHNVKLAIHNHGPGDKVYPSPTDVFEKIKDLDKRIGLCIDIGHVKRIAQDPVAMIEKYKDRLYDMHMKDVNKDTADGTPVEIGRGIIDIPAVVKTLKKINYQGYVSFEYEKDGDDPMPGLAESVGFVRGVMKMI